MKHKHFKVSAIFMSDTDRTPTLVQYFLIRIGHTENRVRF